MSYNYTYGSIADDYAYDHQYWIQQQTSRFRRPGYVPGASGISSGASSSVNQGVNGKQTYASGISDNGFKANKCTDGKDDGKIGFWSAIGNAAEGVVKGAINGVKGALGIEEDGSWNPLKALGTVALVGLSIAFPVVGVVACTVGAVAGTAQVVKAGVAAANATTDAEAKAAWENIGEGASTVIGSVAGAKASMGAMKAASTAAKFGSVDDVTKALGNVDDILKTGNADDIAKALKAKGVSNADELVNSVDDISKISADDLAALVKDKGTTSALSQVDDSLHGLDKMKAQGKAFLQDAKSSSKNNFGKISTKVKTTTSKTQYSKAADNLDDATKALNEVSGSIDDVTKAKYKDSSVDDITKAIDDLSKNADANKDEIKYLEALKKQKTAEASYKTARGKLSDDVAKQVDTDRTAKKYTDSLDDVAKKQADVDAKQTKVDKLKEAGKKAGDKEFDEATKALDEATKALDDAQTKQSNATTELDGLDAKRRQTIDTDRAAKKYTDSLDDVAKKQADVDAKQTKVDELKQAGKKAGDKEFDEATKALDDAQTKQSNATTELDGLDAKRRQTIDTDRKAKMDAESSIKAKQTEISDAKKAKKDTKLFSEERKEAKGKIAEMQKALDEAQIEYDMQYGNRYQKAKATAKHTVNNSETAKYLKGKSVKDIKISDLGSKVSDDAIAVVKFLQNNDNIPEAINQFGYDNVMQVLELYYGIGQVQTSV